MEPKNAEELDAAIRASWASSTAQQHRTMIASLSRHVAAGIHAKWAATTIDAAPAGGTFSSPTLNHTEHLFFLVWGFH